MANAHDNKSFGQFDLPKPLATAIAAVDGLLVQQSNVSRILKSIEPDQEYLFTHLMQTEVTPAFMLAQQALQTAKEFLGKIAHTPAQLIALVNIEKKFASRVNDIDAIISSKILTFALDPTRAELPHTLSIELEAFKNQFPKNENDAFLGPIFKLGQ